MTCSVSFLNHFGVYFYHDYNLKTSTVFMETKISLFCYLNSVFLYSLIEISSLFMYAMLKNNKHFLNSVVSSLPEAWKRKVQVVSSQITNSQLAWYLSFLRALLRCHNVSVRVPLSLEFFSGNLLDLLPAVHEYPRSEIPTSFDRMPYVFKTSDLFYSREQSQAANLMIVNFRSWYPVYAVVSVKELRAVHLGIDRYAHSSQKTLFWSLSSVRLWVLCVYGWPIKEC